jgi:hypothetical protein
VRWLFLFSLSAVGTIATLALSGIMASRNATSCLQLFAQEPHSLALPAMLFAAWAGLINDAAAASGISRILGHEVEFKEITLYGELESSKYVTPLRAKLYVVYPVTMLLHLQY